MNAVTAASYFQPALPPVTEMTSPRAWAFSLLGEQEYLRRFGGDRVDGPVWERQPADIGDRVGGAKRDKPVAGPPAPEILAALSACDFALVGSAD